MNSQAYTNITLQAFGGLISLMIIVFVGYIRRQQSQSDRLYIRFLLCNTLLLFSNVVSWYLDGRAGMLNRILIIAANCVMYQLHYLLLGTITSYLAAFFKQWGIRCKRFVQMVWSIVGVGCLLVLVSQFNGMYYYIDASNTYHRGEWFLLFPLVGILGVAFDLFFLLSKHKLLHSREYHTFVTLLVLAIAALGVQAVFYGAVYLYITTTFVAISIYVFIQAEQARRLSEQALELERSRTAVMLSQIQPHFLYNALASIKELCDTGEQQSTSKALEHFAYYLRGNMDSLLDKRLISFSQEVRHVKDYLYLEKIRFEEKLCIVWKLDVMDFRLPSLTLQPIVENAVRHGITEKKGGGTLTICSKKADNRVTITITDDGEGFDVAQSQDDGRSHIGIENVRSRLEMQCGGSLHIESVRETGTIVTIILPETEVSYDENDSGG